MRKFLMILALCVMVFTGGKDAFALYPGKQSVTIHAILEMMPDHVSAWIKEHVRQGDVEYMITNNKVPMDKKEYTDIYWAARQGEVTKEMWDSLEKKCDGCSHYYDYYDFGRGLRDSFIHYIEAPLFSWLIRKEQENFDEENIGSYVDYNDFQYVIAYESHLTHDSNSGLEKLVASGNVAKDENGNIIYNEKGEPVIKGMVQLGGYTPITNDIGITYAGYKLRTKSNVMASIHHEVQHLKDFNTWEQELKRTKTVFFSSADNITQVLFSAIAEARAYPEEAVFIYNKMKSLEEISKKDESKYEEYKEFLDLYNSDGNPALTAFRKAIQSGKQVEEARHIAAVALLNSCHYIRGSIYMPQFANGNAEFWHVTPEVLIGAFNDDKITLNDLYSAYDFWTALCRFDNMMDRDECRSAKRRYQIKYCIETEEAEKRPLFCKKFNDIISKYIKVPNSMNENFDVDVVFRKMNKIFEVDKICTSETCGDKRRILTTEDDEEYYNGWKHRYKYCCTLDWSFKDLVPEDWCK